MRSAVAAAVGLALVPLSLAWNVELPPCLDDFKPFVSSGCFQDGADPTLIFRSGLDQHNMTVEKCVADCKGNGFRYAGLEYYGVCFCGSTVNGPQVPDSQCSLPCSGNKSETCGGDKALSVWQDPTFSKSPEDVTVDDYKSLGCFTDDSNKGRTLSWPVKVDASSFTTKKCLAACEKGGFPFAGTEYGGECWCGVVLANDTAKVHESECNIPCRGDASDKCGGRARLSLFVAKDLESLEPCGHRPVTTSSSRAVITTTTEPYYKFPSTTTTTPVGTNPVETTSTADKPSNTSSQSGGITSSEPVVTVTSTSLYTSSAPRETTSNAPSESTAPVSSSTTKSGESTASEPRESSSTKPGGTTSSVPEASSSTKAGETTTKPSETSPTGPGETPSSTYGSTSSSYGSSSTPLGSTTNKPSQSTDSSAPGETSTPASSSNPDNSTATGPGKEPTASSSKPAESSQSTKPAGTPSTSSEKEPTASSSSTGKTTTPSAPSATTSSSNAGQPTSSTQSSSTKSGGLTAPTSSSAGQTTSSTKSGETSVPNSSSSRGTTSRPGETTAPTTPPSSTPKNGATSTTASLCTATSTVPSRCEWQRGDWCAPPLPDWNSRGSCQTAAKTCALQVVSCFKYAGWPHTIDCFAFQRWCVNIQQYCARSCRGRRRCDKSDCWSQYKPGYGKPPATTTSVFPCLPASETNKPTATASAKPVTSCPPVPTNICKQPSNGKWGYSPSKPVAGIPLPVVSCNDMRDDWRSRPYKLYTEPDTSDSPSFRWPERPNVCADSCKVQYTQCRDTYVDSCRRLSWKRSFHKRREGETDAEFARRAQPWSGTWAAESEAADASSRNTNYDYCAPSSEDSSWAGFGSDSLNCWGWGGNTPDNAERRCRAQYGDCLTVNAEVKPGDQCKTWCRN